jgi:putative intracellular protease/amidase
MTWQPDLLRSWYRQRRFALHKHRDPYHRGMANTPMKKIEPEKRRSHGMPVSPTLPSHKPMRILIAAIPPVRPLDVVGPVEVFGDANRLRGGDPVYSVEIVASGEEKLMDTHFKMPMLADRTYREVAGSFDTVLVAGGDGVNKMRYQPPFVDWLKKQCVGARRFGSICTGALVLAKAGLLEGRRATTHWNWCDELAQNYPGGYGASRSHLCEGRKLLYLCGRDCWNRYDSGTGGRGSRE